jgi:hypothetical protein
MTIEDQIEQAMIQMFAQMRTRFGRAVKGHWFYDSEACPGCGRKVSPMRHKGKDALSLNAYIYRKRGILIGYILCGRCATEIHRAARRNPGVQIAVHDIIETTLGNAYEAHMNRMDA